MAASHLVQLFWPGRREPDAGKSHVSLPAVDDARVEPAWPVRLSYRDEGIGEVVVLLHGSPKVGSEFDLLAPMLAERFRVVTIDLPGFGDSTWAIPDYSHEAHARYVLALLDELGVESAHFVGFSMGSGVALRAYHLAPQRVESLVFYGGVGIMEGEGSGNHAFERIKNSLGYALLVVAPELTPHFGLLGSRAWRHAFLRNFLDSDFRPLRGILERLDRPLLILHGRNDPLVRAWVAQEHHRIVRHSELVMFNDSHFMVFSESGSAQLAAEIIPFVERHADPAAAPRRRTLDHSADRPARPTILPVDLDFSRDMSPWAVMGTIILGTFILEDPTSVAVGLLIRDGKLDPFVGIIATFTGIFIGDLGLYLIGALAGRRALRWKPIARRMPAHHLDALGQWFDRHGWSAVLASRFFPGTRLPLYVAAGVLGTNRGRFALWTFCAVLIWAPVIVTLVILFGDRATSPFRWLFGEGWFSVIVAVILLLVLLRTSAMMTTRPGQQRLAVLLSRLWRWEFWPVSLFYLPLVPWIGWLALRYRGLTVPTAANPGIAHGGIVGESKYAILSALPRDRIVPSAILHAAQPNRLGALRRIMEERQWAFPLVLKPDVGERGEGLKLVRDWSSAGKYFTRFAGDVLAQTYDPGPHEAGIFYYRIPGESRGRIFSITVKRFPVLVGDGRSTFEDLIWSHPRYRMQAWTFLNRYDTQIDRVLAAGERMPLAVSGNHSQGTMFCEGWSLWTPALETAIDEAARAFEGFCLGRFDVRYSDEAEFRAGRDWRIVELNGVLSESGNVYDPQHSLWFAYRTLARQWALAFEIGARNRDAGAPVTPLRTLWSVVRSHRRNRHVDTLAD